MNKKEAFRAGSNIAVWLLVGFLVYLIIKNWGVEDWWDANTWQIVAAIATWLLAGGIVFAILQVRQARLSTNAQIAVPLFRALREKEAKVTLQNMYKLRQKDLLRLLTNPSTKEEVDQRNRIEDVIDNLELISALVKQGIINEQIAIEAYSGSTVLRCWYKLKEYIEEARKQRGDLYCKYLEDFAWRTWDYQSRKSPQKEHIRFYPEKPSESFDLVQYLNDNPTLQPKK